MTWSGRHGRAAGFGVLLAGQLLGLTGWAEEGGVWRWFGPAQGLSSSAAEALTVGPKGVLWVRHQGGGGVSAFDGYTVRRIPAPPEPGQAVHENRTGQIWTLDRAGIRELRREEWYLHGVDAVREGFRSEGHRTAGGIRLLPAERNRLLILLPEVLLKHDVLQRTTETLVRAEALRIGEWLHAIEARDGQVWLVGSAGLAWAAGPVRRLDEETRWEAVSLPDSWGPGVRLRRDAFERPGGGIVTLGERVDGGELLALVYDGVAWQEPIPVPEGTVRVWEGQGGSWWCCTRRTLYGWRANGWVEVRPPGMEEVELLEVAVEPGGEFWLATTRGLLRRADALWQAPAGWPGGREPLGSVLEMPGGSLWFGGGSGLLVRRETGWSSALPPSDRLDGLEGRIYRLGSQVVFRDRAGRVGMVDEEGYRWRVRVPAAGWRVERLLGLGPDGRLIAQVRGEAGGSGWRLEVFDGERFEVWWEPPGDWPLGDRLHFAAVSRSGRLWLGAEGGLALWHDRSGGFLPVEGYGSGPALSLVDAGDVRVWCASGTTVYEGDGRTWSNLRPSPGPLERLVVLRDGTVWGLGRGSTPAARFFGGAWLRHGVEEGLPLAGVDDLHLDARGRLWAATEEGVRRHVPDADMEPPRTQVTSLGGRRQFTTRERVPLVLRGIDRWHYAPAENLVYSTRLNEGAWSVYSPVSVLVLSNLTAGQHRLEVRSMDPAMNEEPEPAVFEFIAFVPWYGEPRIVAVGLVGLTVALLLAVLAVNRHFRLVRSYAEVERIVEDRTQELERANAELVHSQKMRALGTLAAGIAHDFNSLLSIIRGSAQIIEDSPTDMEKIRMRVDRIKKMVDQGAGIVKAMLGLSRASREDWRLTEVGELVEEACRLVADQLPKGVKLHVDREPDLPPVRLVADLFRQLLFNLILNGAESMSGQGEILLRVRRGEAMGALVVPPVVKGEQLVVEVLDTGHGIAPEALSRIFEPFFTTKAFSTRRGTGLGLTMVYEIARELGLGLGVESSLGQGSMFRIYVPVNRQLPTGAGWRA